MSKVRSIRADEKEWDAWGDAAQLAGKSLNAYVTDAVNLVSDRDLAEKHRAEAEKHEREHLKAAMQGYTFKPDPKR